VGLKDSAFVVPEGAAAERKKLVEQYVAAFRHVEVGARDAAQGALSDLAGAIASAIVTEQQSAIKALVEGQRAKLG
jgi:hypothetical protein